MHGPENAVDGLLVTIALIDHQQPALQFVEQVFAFLEKGLLDAIH